MWINILMAVSLYPVLLVLYFSVKAPAKYENSLLFGITMKKEWLEEPEVKALTEALKRQYKKELSICTLICALVPCVCFFIPYLSIQLTIWCMWVFVIIVVLMIPQIRAHKKLMQWKKDQGYMVEETDNAMYVELREAGQIRRVKLTQYLPSILVSIVAVINPFVYRMATGNADNDPVNNSVYYILWATLVITNVAIYLVALWMDKRKTEVISANSDVNVSYTRAKKQTWNQLWLRSSYLATALLTVLAATYWLGDRFVTFMIFGTCVYGLVQILLIGAAIRRKAFIDKVYQDKRDFEYVKDEDKYWIWGMFYYNPHDTRSMVDTRYGMGTTVNMARPLGKILDGVAVASILFCAVLFAWVIREEFTPIELRMADGYIEAVHTGVEYRIGTGEIESVTLLDKLPRMSKSRGNGMDTLLEGTFYVRDEGQKCEVLLNPQNDCFIRLETADMIYYFGGVDDAQTMEVYLQVIP